MRQDKTKGKGNISKAQRFWQRLSLAIFWIVFAVLLVLDIAQARSAAINQSLTEFTNLTTADNALEVTQEVNKWVGGMIGILLLVVIFAVAFGVTLYTTQDVSKALVPAFFIELFSAIILKLVGLVPDTALYYSFPLFILSIGYAAVANRGG